MRSRLSTSRQLLSSAGHVPLGPHELAYSDPAGQDIQEEPLRQPVVPELAVSLGPMSMAISGTSMNVGSTSGTCMRAYL